MTGAKFRIDETKAALETGDHVKDHDQRLREAGLSDEEISDVIHGAAFFNWANRLMLSLGEPTPAA
jgi:alkylhydroperoxidase family enzyme